MDNSNRASKRQGNKLSVLQTIVCGRNRGGGGGGGLGVKCLSVRMSGVGTFFPAVAQNASPVAPNFSNFSDFFVFFLIVHTST